MAMRESLSRDYSENLFTRSAQYVHPKNNLQSGLSGHMRGGIRL